MRYNTASREPLLCDMSLPVKNLCYAICHCQQRTFIMRYITAIREPLLCDISLPVENLCYAICHCHQRTLLCDISLPVENLYYAIYHCQQRTFVMRYITASRVTFSFHLSNLFVCYAIFIKEVLFMHYAVCPCLQRTFIMLYACHHRVTILQSCQSTTFFVNLKGIFS